MRFSCFVLTAILLASTASAEPIAIDVLSAQYSTFVWAQYNTTDTTVATIERTQTGIDPISDSLSVNGYEWERVIASTFLIYNYADSMPLSDVGHPLYATRTETQLTFAPTADASLLFELDFTAYQQSQFTDGFIGLIDLTANQTVWQYGWDSFANGTVPWDVAGSGFSASILADTTLLASNLYQLTMWMSTSGNDGHGQELTMSINGLEIVSVPEPSTWLLLSLGSGLVSLRRRR